MRHRLLSLAAACAVASAGLVVGLDSPRPAAAASTVPIAVYRGPGPWGASLIPAYESFAGRPVDKVLDFQDVDTWSNQEWPGWQSDAWKGRTVVLGGSGVFVNGGTWAAAARGDYDSHWLTLGQRLVATGQADAVLRGAHEFNGDWFNYRVSSADVSNFVTAWRRWVDIMRSVPGQHFTFDWNPTIGTEALRHPDDAYPGDAWVDHIALDVYDGWYPRGWKPGVDAPPTTAERDAVWNEIMNGERGLVWWRTFSQQHAKQLSFPEWGLRLWTEGDGLVHGGGDNPVFIDRMANVINTWNVAYAAFWEDPGKGVSDADGSSNRVVSVPLARAAWLTDFGGIATPTTTTAVTTTTTARTVPSTTTTAATTTTTKPPTTTTSTTTTSTTSTRPTSSTTTTAPTGRRFFRGLNLNGPAVTIDGNSWEGKSATWYTQSGYGSPAPSAPLSPATDAARASMLQRGVVDWNLRIALLSVPTGRYEVSVYTWENDWDQVFSMNLQGVRVVTDYNTVGAGHWSKLGPFTTSVSNGRIDLGFEKWASNISGIEVWRLD